MDFGGLPPEINSARMYAGPGPGSMLTSASAWDSLASELRSTAMSYGTVTSELTDGTWQGPSSAAMEEAVTPYVAWLNSAAAEAEQTATQARAAASAYQTAFTSMVPPETIAANRMQLAMLNATNTFGQNTPAISTTEAQYGEMWAQDAAAMYSYAGNSAAAARVTPFTAPPSTTNPAGAATQSAATAQAVGTSSGAGAQSALSQLVTSVPTSLQSLASPAATTAPTSLSTLLTNFLNSLSSTSGSSSTTSIFGDGSSLIQNLQNDILLFGLFAGLNALGPVMGTPISYALTQAMAPAAAAAAPAMAAAAPAAAAMGGAVGGFAGGAGGFAGLGAASSVGVLSVPPSWGTAATPTWLASMPLGSALPGVASPEGGMPMGIPFLPSGAGSAAGIAAAAGVGGAVASRYGPRLKVLTRSPGAGYSPTPMAPAGAYGVPPGVPPAPGYTPHIVYLPNNEQNGHNGNGHNGYGHNGYGHNGYGRNGNGHNGNGHGPN